MILADIFSDILKVKKISVKSKFFEIGGDSLKATLLVTRIHKNFNVEITLKDVFKASTIRELAKFVINANKSIYTSIQPVPEQEYYLASSAQKRLFIMNRMGSANTSYNMPIIKILEGKLDVERFENCFKELVKRHEALRTSFKVIDDQVVQVINKDVEFKISNKELSEEQARMVVEEFVQPFDLGKAPLLRVELIKVLEDRYIFLFDMYHIVSDGILSVETLFNEFSRLYQGEELEELRIQYKDYTGWQNEFFKTDVIKEQEKFWLEIYSDGVPKLELPLDYPRPSEQSFEGNNIIFKVEDSLKEKLFSLVSVTETSLNMVLLAAYYVLLSKYSYKNDIVVGIPVAGRPHADLENIVGMFINSLPVRSYPEREKTFVQFLEEVKDTLFRVYNNQEYPLEELVEKLDLQRDLNRNPMFDTMFALQKADALEIKVDGLKCLPYEFINKTAKFDLVIMAYEGQEIEIVLEYCKNLFKEESMIRMSEHYLKVLELVSANMNIKINEIELESGYTVKEEDILEEMEFRF